MKRLIACIAVLMLLSSVALAATGTVRIWGTNQHNANQNTSVSLAPQNITIRAFDGNTTTFSSTVNNATDTLTFSIANQTNGRVLELRINNTVIDAYQVNSTGWVSFTRTQLTSNQTYSLTPAVNIGGYNATWMRIQRSSFLTNFSTNCVLNTVYQNTNSTVMFVTYTGYSNADATLSLLSDNLNPPQLDIDSDLYESTINNRAKVSGFVLPGHYYQLTMGGASALTSCRGWY